MQHLIDRQRQLSATLQTCIQKINWITSQLYGHHPDTKSASRAENITDIPLSSGYSPALQDITAFNQELAQQVHDALVALEMMIDPPPAEKPTISSLAMSGR